eukprot:Em0023g254a
MVLELDEKVGDVYAQLSVYGLYLLVILLVLICLAWSRYGAAISTVFDAKAGLQLEVSSPGPALHPFHFVPVLKLELDLP